MSPFRCAAPWLLAAGLWPLAALATSPYDAELLPAAELGGIGIAECTAVGGGLDGGGTCEFAADARLQLRGGPKFWWRGFSLVADLEALGGGHPSSDHVGDAQGVSNIEAPGALRPYEFYVAQDFPRAGSQFRLGLIEISDQFMTIPGTAELINSSFGLIPTVSLNVPTSTFPKPGWGATFEHRLGRHWRFRAGVFQGHPERRTRPFDGGAMVIGEAEYDSVGGAALSAGVWHYGQPGGGGDGNPRHDTGAQISASLPLREGRLRVFAQVGIAPGHDNVAPYYAEMGLRWRGPIPGRAHDSLSAAVGRAWIRNAGGLGTETVPELIYSARVAPGVFLQPDLQYVARPLGEGLSHADAVVGILRIYASIH